MPLFYTIQTNNIANTTSPLSFEITTPQPILKKPSDWSVSVIRYDIPNFTTPIFTFIDNYYQMTMTYNGNTTSTYVVYQPFTSNSAFRGVFDIQDYVIMLNNTINTLFTQMNALLAPATLPTTDQPYFSYSETTTLLSFTANKNYFATDGSVATPIEILANYPLFQQIQGLPVFANGTTSFQLIVQNLKNGNTGTTYITMTSQQPFLQQLTDFQGIVLTSNLPVLNEYVGYTNNIIGVTGSQSQQFALPILQDYTSQELTISNFHEHIVYNAVVPYRQTQIMSDASFNVIHIDAFTTNSSGILKRCTLPPNDSANIKIMFTLNSRNNFA